MAFPARAFTPEASTWVFLQRGLFLETDWVPFLCPPQAPLYPFIEVPVMESHRSPFLYFPLLAWKSLTARGCLIVT